MKPFVLPGLAGALLAAPAAAQLNLSLPNFQAEVVTSGVAAHGSSMAVDRFGNVYVAGLDPTTPGPYAVAQVSGLDASVNEVHASGFDQPGELAYNPTDGLVYLVDVPAGAVAPFADVYRLDPAGGAVLVGSVDVAARGLAIDNNGRYYFGGDGAQGVGLYHVDPPFLAGTTPATFDSVGFKQNTVMEALSTGDVVIGAGMEAERFDVATGTMQDYYKPNVFVGNQFETMRSIARSPFNSLGEGAFLAINAFTTICFCGTGSTFFGPPLGQLGPAGFGEFIGLADENYQTFPFGDSNGLRAVAAGPRPRRAGRSSRRRGRSGSSRRRGR